VRVVDLAAATLSDSSGLVAGADPTWIDDEQLAYVVSCCFPDFADAADVNVIRVDQPDDPRPIVGGGAASLSGDGTGRLVLVSATGDVLTSGGPATDYLTSFLDVHAALEVGL
jgi:hypothetical protein